jgi:hypothetical protein
MSTTASAPVSAPTGIGWALMLAETDDFPNSATSHFLTKLYKATIIETLCYWHEHSAAVSILVSPPPFMLDLNLQCNRTKVRPFIILKETEEAAELGGSLNDHEGTGVGRA